MNTELDQNNPTLQTDDPQTFTPPVREQTNEVVGFWPFLGLMALFAFPVVGFIACIVFMFAPKKKSMKNYARAAFTWMILQLVAAIIAVTMFVGIIGGLILPTVNNYLGTEIGNIFEIVGLASDFMNGNYSAVIEHFRAPLLEAIGVEYAPLLDEFSSGKYDELLDQIKDGDYDDLLEDLNEGKYRELVEKIDKEDYNALRSELEAAARGEPSKLFDQLQSYMNGFPIN